MKKREEKGIGWNQKEKSVGVSSSREHGNNKTDKEIEAIYLSLSHLSLSLSLFTLIRLFQ